MSSTPRLIYLVGPMGSGKTTVGRKVASHLELEFVDCDEEIERRTGASINLIFDIEGEAGFRKREADVLAELAGVNGRLIATGGGAVLSQANRDLMNRSGLIVWLKTSVEQQARRLEKDKKRPLLQTDAWREKLLELANVRDPLYASVADLEFESSERSAQITARDLATVIQAEWGEEKGRDNHAIH